MEVCPNITEHSEHKRPSVGFALTSSIKAHPSKSRQTRNPVDYLTTLGILFRQKNMESQDPTFQTQYGDMGPEHIFKDEDLTPPSLSAILADESIDRISVKYRELWITKASANRNGPFRVPQDDLDRIQNVIAPAAMKWELENGTVDYHHDQSPIPHEHEGFQDAKIVPIELNLDEGESMHSFAADKALRNNDFSAQSKSPEAFIPPGLERWRLYDRYDRLKQLYPAHYIVWKDAGDSLYARIPKPLEGLSRAASCDHCRIHEPESAWDEVEYFDDRKDVGNKKRKMGVTDSAIIPFSLCRFHWWYVWSGELLRPSHVRALELLVSRSLFHRWGISHMREFLSWMENSSPPNVPQATVASADEQHTVPGNQAAGATTSNGPDDTTDSDKSSRELQNVVFRELVLQEHDRMAELTELANAAGPGNRTDLARQAVFRLASRAYRRRRRHVFWMNIIEAYREVFPAPADGQETNGLDSQHTNGDSQNLGDIHNTESVLSSAPAPACQHSGAAGPSEPSRTNGQSTAPRTDASMAGANDREQAAVKANGLGASNPIAVNSHQQSDDAPAPQANGLVASNPVATVPRTQTNGEPERRENGFLYQPPTEPRSMRQRR